MKTLKKKEESVTEETTTKESFKERYEKIKGIFPPDYSFEDYLREVGEYKPDLAAEPKDGKW